MDLYFVIQAGVDKIIDVKIAPAAESLRKYPD